MPSARHVLDRFAGYVLGAYVGLSLALAIDLRAAYTHRAGEFTFAVGTYGRAALHLVGLSAPLMLGLAIAAVLVDRFVLPRSVSRFLDLRHALAPAPEALVSFAEAAVSVVFAAAAFLATSRYARSTFHAEVIVEAVSCLVGAALAFGAFHLVRRLRPLALRGARALDRGASPLVAMVILAEVALALKMHVAEVAPTFDRSIPHTPIHAALGFVFGLFWVGGTLAARGTPRIVVSAAVVAVATLAVTPYTYLRYGSTSSQRFLVEELSYVGNRLHRATTELLDRDGDGYPALLGGRDCNDTRADVHPGALDVSGDTLDADCFAGDGTPPYDDRTDGRRVLPKLGRRKPHLVFISIDTMRPDRLRALGATRSVAPRIDAFARSAVVFRTAVASSPRTTRSLPAIFTGHHPGRVRYVRAHNRLDIAQSNETLAERLDEEYTTAAVVGTSYFRAAPGMLQGFQSVDEPTQMKPPPEWVTQRAVPWIDRLAQASRPHFLWFHYFSPHEPYLQDRTPSRFGPRLEDLYDTEVSRADHEVGVLLDRIHGLGLDDDCVVVVFSDHGESLGERGTLGHSTRLEREQIDAVLVVRAPDTRAHVVDTPVALLDVFSTSLDFAGIDPTEGIASRSLVPCLTGRCEGLEGRPLFSEIMPDAIYAIAASSVRVGHEKLVLYPESQRHRYYDLRTDPRELVDVADRAPESVERLLGLLRSWDASSHLPENSLAQQIASAIVPSLPRGVEPLDARFANGITLVGAQANAESVARDGILHVDLYFRAERPIPADYAIQLVYEPDGSTNHPARLEARHTPVDGSYPTSRWRPGQIIRDSVDIRVPAGHTPGVPLIGRVELWGDFHLPAPVSVQRDGGVHPSVPIGSLIVL